MAARSPQSWCSGAQSIERQRTHHGRFPAGLMTGFHQRNTLTNGDLVLADPRGLAVSPFTLQEADEIKDSRARLLRGRECGPQVYRGTQRTQLSNPSARAWPVYLRCSRHSWGSASHGGTEMFRSSLVLLSSRSTEPREIKVLLFWATGLIWWTTGDNLTLESFLSFANVNLMHLI